jgi:hypothetical protein
VTKVTLEKLLKSIHLSAIRKNTKQLNLVTIFPFETSQTKGIEKSLQRKDYWERLSFTNVTMTKKENVSVAQNLLALFLYWMKTLSNSTIIYKQQLMDFASGQLSKQRLNLSKLVQKANYLSKDDIIRISDDVYCVPSQSVEKKSYSVDTSIGVC